VDTEKWPRPEQDIAMSIIAMAIIKKQNVYHVQVTTHATLIPAKQDANVNQFLVAISSALGAITQTTIVATNNFDSWKKVSEEYQDANAKKML